MSHYRFVGGDIPDHYTLAFEPTLFNLEEHRALQAFEGWRSYFILDDDTRKAEGVIHFHISDRIARSHLRSPFGSFDTSADVPVEVVARFLTFVQDELRAHADRVIVRHPPAPYCKVPALEVLLTNDGFHITNAEVSSILDTAADTPLHRVEARKLRRAEEAGLTFVQNNADDMRRIFRFVNDCRASKGYVLSMDESELAAAVARFPDRYSFFSVLKDETIAAAAITVRTRHDFLYDFAHDHNDTFDALSPVVMLVQGLRSFCRAHGIRHLDLGTSNAGGTINFGLLTFKTRLGAAAFPKYTFEKILY